MKLFILVACLLVATLAGANPADYDPFFDNTHDTYHVLASLLSFKQVDTGEGFTPPKPGPNAEACKEVWDKSVPCPSDGKFYGYWGEEQPEYC